MDRSKGAAHVKIKTAEPVLDERQGVFQAKLYIRQAVKGRFCFRVILHSAFGRYKGILVAFDFFAGAFPADPHKLVKAIVTANTKKGCVSVQRFSAAGHWREHSIGNC